MIKIEVENKGVDFASARVHGRTTTKLELEGNGGDILFELVAIFDNLWRSVPHDLFLEAYAAFIEGLKTNEVHHN